MMDDRLDIWKNDFHCRMDKLRLLLWMMRNLKMIKRGEYKYSEAAPVGHKFSGIISNFTVH